MDLKETFSYCARKVLCTYNEVATIPTDKVKEELKKKGWQFETRPIKTDFGAAYAPYFVAGEVLRETVLTSDKRDIFLEGNKEDLQRYDEDKKAAARQVYGIQ